MLRDLFRSTTLALLVLQVSLSVHLCPAFARLPRSPQLPAFTLRLSSRIGTRHFYRCLSRASTSYMDRRGLIRHATETEVILEDTTTAATDRSLTRLTRFRAGSITQDGHTSPPWFLGQTVTTISTPRGEVVTTTPSGYTSDIFPLILPSGPVHLGNSWVSYAAIENPVPLTLTSRMTLAAIEHRMHHRVARIDITAHRVSASSSPNAPSANASGVMHFDLDDGVVVSLTLRLFSTAFYPNSPLAPRTAHPMRVAVSYDVSLLTDFQPNSIPSPHPLLQPASAVLDR